MNVKMISVETITGMGGEDKGGDRGGEFFLFYYSYVHTKLGSLEVNSIMIYLIHCKKVYKCHNVLPSSATIKKKRKGLFPQSLMSISDLQ
jgi:hypothetical protein